MTSLDGVFRKRFKDIAHLDDPDDDGDLIDQPESKTLSYYRYGHEIENKYLAADSGLYFRWSKLRRSPAYEIPTEAEKFHVDGTAPDYLYVGVDGVNDSKYRNIVVDPQYWLPLYRVICPNRVNPEYEYTYTFFVQVRKNSPFHGHVCFYAEQEEGSYSFTMRHISEYLDSNDVDLDLHAVLDHEEGIESERFDKIRQVLDNVYSKAPYIQECSDHE